MEIYKLLDIEPETTKVHLASWNGQHNPLEVYFDGNFKEWQECQTKRNFQRDYILSLISLPGDNLWLFAGIYLSHEIYKSENGRHYYRTEFTDLNSDLVGRLVIQYKRKGRNSYPNGESLFGDAIVHEIKPEPMAFSDFKSFKQVNLSRQQLELLFRHQYPSWKTALTSVSGVYLLSDRSTGLLYVGSAYGEGGFWGRWHDYFTQYHGGNKGLKLLLNESGSEGFSNFHYSILETCDIDLPADAIIALENQWKDKLLSREFGYNEN